MLTMRTATEIIETIHAARGDGDKHGLRNTAALLEALQAWPMVPVVHIAGTNGKGSACALVERVLRAAGYRTGLYTSPFLQIYEERIRIKGAPLSLEGMEKYGNLVLDAAERLRAEKGYRCTPFELGTALALKAFQAENVEVIILETGMGGRLDPTNAIPSAAVCAIMEIGLDHMQYLGNTLEEIAGEKAGIIKAGVPVVCAPHPPEVRRVIAERAAHLRAPVIQLESEDISHIRLDAHGSTADYVLVDAAWRELWLALPGVHQTRNALAALSILRELRAKGMNIPDGAIREGFHQVRWPGRLEWCGNILLDGAHNAQGMEALVRFAELLPAREKRVLLTGVLTEKWSEGMGAELRQLADRAVTVTPDSPRAMTGEELAERLRELDMEANPSPDLAAGLAEAKRLAGEEGIVIVCGSLYLIGAVRTLLGLNP